LIPNNTRLQWILVLASLVAYAGNTWLNTWEREGEARAIAAGFMVGTLMFVWAAIWAASTRGADRKFNFRRHAAVIATGALVALLFAVTFEWLQFFFPDAEAVYILAGLFGIVFIAALVAEHLGVRTMMSLKRRWRAGFVVSVISFVVAGLIGMTRDTERFTDVAEVVGNMKPINDNLVPAMTPSEFASDLKDLQQAVDSLVKK
jgi:MFS family permease